MVNNRGSIMDSLWRKTVEKKIMSVDLNLRILPKILDAKADMSHINTIKRIKSKFHNFKCYVKLKGARRGWDTSHY